VHYRAGLYIPHVEDSSQSHWPVRVRWLLVQTFRNRMNGPVLDAKASQPGCTAYGGVGGAWSLPEKLWYIKLIPKPGGLACACGGC